VATGLVVGDVYDVTGSGIPVGATFTYTGAFAGVLSAPAETSLSTTPVTISRPAGVGPWLTSGDTPAGVSMYAVDATAAVTGALFLARDCEVRLDSLVFPVDTDYDVVAGLAGIGIICRI
jgi:Bacteriophage lambda head decoration protein D